MCPAFGSLRVGLPDAPHRHGPLRLRLLVYGLTFTSHFYGARRTRGILPFNFPSRWSPVSSRGPIRNAMHELADPEQYDAIRDTKPLHPHPLQGSPWTSLPRRSTGCGSSATMSRASGVPTHAEAKGLLFRGGPKYAREEAEKGAVPKPRGLIGRTGPTDPAGELFPVDPVGINAPPPPMGMAVGTVVPTPGVEGALRGAGLVRWWGQSTPSINRRPCASFAWRDALWWGSGPVGVDWNQRLAGGPSGTAAGSRRRRLMPPGTRRWQASGAALAAKPHQGSGFPCRLRGLRTPGGPGPHRGRCRGSPTWEPPAPPPSGASRTGSGSRPGGPKSSTGPPWSRMWRPSRMWNPDLVIGPPRCAEGEAGGDPRPYYTKPHLARPIFGPQEPGRWPKTIGTASRRRERLLAVRAFFEGWEPATPPATEFDVGPERTTHRLGAERRRRVARPRHGEGTRGG